MRGRVKAWTFLLLTFATSAVEQAGTATTATLAVIRMAPR
jgi:hypothetical protein